MIDFEQVHHILMAEIDCRDPNISRLIEVCDALRKQIRVQDARIQELELRAGVSQHH